MKKGVLFLIAGILLLLGCQRIQGPLLSFTTSAGTTPIHVEIADTMATWEKGLMDRQSLPANQGMLFLFPTEEPKTFWMKNMHFPLDVIFLDAKYHIVDIKENFQPCTTPQCELYTSKTNIKAAVEVNTGFAKAHNLHLGDTATYTG